MPINYANAKFVEISTGRTTSIASFNTTSNTHTHSKKWYHISRGKMIAPFLSSLCQSRRNLSKFRMSVSYFTINRRSALPFFFFCLFLLTFRTLRVKENRLGKAAEPKSASVRLRFFRSPPSWVRQKVLCRGSAPLFLRAKKSSFFMFCCELGASVSAFCGALLFLVRNR